MEQDDDDPLESSPVPGGGERIWLHPSELARLLPAPAGEGDHRSRHRRSSRHVLAVSVLSGTIGAVLPLGVLGLAGGFGPPKTNQVFERVADPSATRPAASDGVSQLATAVAPAVVAVHASTPTGTRFGSGVVFRSDGHVLTSSHLVDGATAIELTGSDGRSWSAQQTGSDPGSDLAVLSSDNVATAPAVLGSAQGLRVGQTAMALGAPAGPQGTPSVTVGVISGISETTKAPDHPLYDMIATDAAIPPRAWGGPLVDRSGAVVGIISQTGTSEDHLGLVVPIDHARRVAEKLIASGRMTYPWLGVSGTDLDPAAASEYGARKGARIRHVTPKSPADQSGLEVEDVVTAVDGRPITTMDELTMLVRRHQPGDVVELTIARPGFTRKAKVRLTPTPPIPTGAENVLIP